MYEEELNQIITESNSIAVIKVYNKLIHMESIKGGVISSKKYIAEELGFPVQTISYAIKLPISSGYITKTTFQGQTQFILNKICEDKKEPEKSAENKIKSPPNEEIVRKGGKTIIRKMVPGF